MNSFKAELARVIAEAEAALGHVPDAQVQRERELAKRKAEAEHVQTWRLNLARYAPVSRWRDAWTATETEPVQIVNDWMAGLFGDRHIALFGPVGVGKTIAAAYWVKRLVEPGKFTGNPVAWLRPDDLVSAVCHSYDPNAPRLTRNIVLDEMGEEKREDFVHAMCKLLDRDGHRILITSNLTKDAFKARYSSDPKFIERLEHEATAFFLGGTSMRSKEGGFI